MLASSVVDVLCVEAGCQYYKLPGHIQDICEIKNNFTYK